MIVSFTDRWPDRTLIDHAAAFPSSVGDRTLPAHGIALDVQVIARVNAGRWIGDCPQPACNGAEFVNLHDPRFFCCECRNAGVNGMPIKIVVPDAKAREHIETVLLERPVPGTRNWTGETVKQLETENEANL